VAALSDIGADWTNLGFPIFRSGFFRLDESFAGLSSKGPSKGTLLGPSPTARLRDRNLGPRPSLGADCARRSPRIPAPSAIRKKIPYGRPWYWKGNGNIQNRLAEGAY